MCGNCDKQTCVCAEGDCPGAGGSELDGIDLSAIGDKPVLVVKCGSPDQLHRVQEVLVQLWPELKKRTKLETVLLLPKSVDIESLSDDELLTRYRLVRATQVGKSSLVDAAGKPIISGGS